MTNPDKQAVLALCFMAAFADGAQSEAERAALESLAKRLAGADLNLGVVLEDALMKRLTVQDVAGRLRSADVRRSAYEMAVCICQADDVLNDAERWFLAEARKALGIADEVAAVIESNAQRIAVPTPVETAALAVPPVLPGSDRAAARGVSASPAAKGTDAMDRSILNHALLAGGLELLPNSLATMAIIPLQMKMVYGIGKEHGYELDRGHIKDFLATLGVGMGSQVIEGYATRMLTGLAGKFLGRMGRAVVGQAMGPAFSFASTYALGQAAKQYYAGGRRLGAVELRRLFEGLLGEGRSLQKQYLPQIRDQAGRIRVDELVPVLMGRR